MQEVISDKKYAQWDITTTHIKPLVSVTFTVQVKLVTLSLVKSSKGVQLSSYQNQF